MVRVCKEESFHARQGFDIMMALCRGTAEQKAMAQDAIERWWWPSLMMFGPKDDESPNTGNAIKWKIKRETNDQLRQRFVNQTVPQAEHIGLVVPDKDLKWNDEKNGYDFGPIDWNEFWNVVKGNGPCNKERMTAKVKAHTDGAWVREAAYAYAEKQKNNTKAA
jgi:ring-1,2-phenylacetyl-CoA epoxidase subunit PaaA